MKVSKEIFQTLATIRQNTQRLRRLAAPPEEKKLKGEIRSLAKKAARLERQIAADLTPKWQQANENYSDNPGLAVQTFSELSRYEERLIGVGSDLSYYQDLQQRYSRVYQQQAVIRRAKRASFALALLTAGTGFLSGIWPALTPSVDIVCPPKGAIPDSVSAAILASGGEYAVQFAGYPDGTRKYTCILRHPCLDQLPSDVAKWVETRNNPLAALSHQQAE